MNISEDIKLVDLLIIEDKYKQPREKFKGNCPVFSIVKARIKGTTTSLGQDL